RLTDPRTWQVEFVTELNLAVPFIVFAVICPAISRRKGWRDVRGWATRAPLEPQPRSTSTPT
ncbi:MAG: hypothetical protein LH630_02915, partial [Actinomycetia bacterium]|nr:hypothetical protein [Actinomycetes bacterium]